MKAERVIDATRTYSVDGPAETVSVIMKPGSILVYGAPSSADLLNYRLSRLGLKLSLTHRSICG